MKRLKKGKMASKSLLRKLDTARPAIGVVIFAGKAFHKHRTLGMLIHIKA